MITINNDFNNLYIKKNKEQKKRPKNNFQR